ncbi:FHA domain-containing protein [Nocardioides sp. HM23]|uniref:FHA domain-containing protein n=1 Tax=Nocardioides bizhenqiangii TaxID=3095076 RepID=UPI002ACA3AB5|nr:FHA domain-containing protein [Nocardioides sp. HM23]MDZ5622893.1 FHA domain-containing protein [Nocardioides sp. HM23]
MKQSAEDWTRSTVVPGAGEGTLARIGPVVLLVGSTDPDVVRPYVDHAQMVAANGGQGRQLVRGYALMLSTAVDQSPGFAALAPHATGLAVFVDGDVVVTVGDERISGADSLAWVERLIPWPIDEVTVTLPGADAADPASTYRLDGGVIQAGALVVPAGAPTGDSMVMPAPVAETPEAPAAAEPVAAPPAAPPTSEEPLDEMTHTPASPVWPEAPAAPEPAAAPAAPPPAPAPPPVPAAPAMAHDHDHAGHDHPHAGAPAGRPLPPPQADERIEFQSVLIDELDDDDFEPLPIVDDASVIENAPGGSPKEEVRGVYCKNRHFNDPRQLFCAVCGINMVQQTPVLVNGIRPPLGVVVLDDGSVFQLDTPYLLGRDPNADERVRSSDFRGLPIIDQSNQVSRVHARLELRGWDVVLIDNNSTNGTFIHVPKTPDWQRMPAGAEHILVQGTRIRIGHRTLAFNTHAGSSS